MSIGIWQVVLILAIVLILFGAGKLPKVMGDVAKGIKNFKSGMKEDETPTATGHISQSAEAEPSKAQPHAPGQAEPQAARPTETARS
jgi:sec-independent protein translocase protein TatA